VSPQNRAALASKGAVVFDADGSLDTCENGHSLAAMSGIRDASLPWHAKLVAYTLISRAKPTDEGWVCWPSLSRIAKDCGISRKQVTRALGVLKEEGLIDWRRGDCTTSNRYCLDYLAMEARKEPGRGRGR
jgi:hypothetical protein